MMTITGNVAFDYFFTLFACFTIGMLGIYGAASFFRH